MTILTESSNTSKSSNLGKFEMKWGYIFISPWLLGFFAFTFLPTIATLGLSFTNFNLVNAEEFEFVGFANYARFFNDPDVFTSLWVTTKFTVLAVPVGIIVPLLLAALLNSKNLWGKAFFRALFYMPFIVPLVSAVYIWQGFLNTNSGWLNSILGFVGITGPDWLFTPTWIVPALLIVSLWGIGNAFLTMLSSMQGVSQDLYDAARVDGAGPIRVFWSITVPIITPVIFYNLILIMIGTFNYFLIPLVLKGISGDPGGATLFYNLYLYRTFFRFQDMAYGATLAWVMFVIVLVVTLILFGTSRYWVFYAGERNS